MDKERRLMVYLHEELYLEYRRLMLEKFGRINASGLVVELIAKWIEENGGKNFNNSN